MALAEAIYLATSIFLPPQRTGMFNLILLILGLIKELQTFS